MRGISTSYHFKASSGLFSKSDPSRGHSLGWLLRGEIWKDWVPNEQKLWPMGMEKKPSLLKQSPGGPLMCQGGAFEWLNWWWCVKLPWRGCRLAGAGSAETWPFTSLDEKRSLLEQQKWPCISVCASPMSPLGMSLQTLFLPWLRAKGHGSWALRTWLLQVGRVARPTMSHRAC